MRARQLLAWTAATGMLLLLLVLARTDTADAGTFNPVLEVELEHTDPETPSDFTLKFGIENSSDVNFGGVISFIPPDFGIVRGDKLPIGLPVGELDALATLGIINAACNSALAVHFDFLNATTDKSSTVSFDDLEEEAGDTSAEGFGTDDFAEDKDGNGIFDSIDHWPEFIDRIVGDVQPFRRSAGIAPVAGTPVLLQFLIYNPGTVFDLPGEDLENLLPNDEALGFPTIVLLQNLGDPDIDPEPGPITDFCTPLTSTNVAFGTTLDADRDGTSNEDDTCPYDAHPLMGTHDADFDFLHTQCDPDDKENEADPSQSGKNEDQDEDGVENFGDNCAVDANEDQLDGDEDFIGDVCDENPTEQDGVINLSMHPQPGTYNFTVFTVGQRDADNDGFQNSLDSCPFIANVGNPNELNDGDANDPNIRGDADGDGLNGVCDPDDTAPNGDDDGDGYQNRGDNCPIILNGQESSDDPTGNQNDEDFDTIGDLCDTAPDTPDGELIDRTLIAELIIGGGGPGGPPTNCPDCQVPGDDAAPDAGEDQPTDAPEGSPEVVDPPNGDDGGSSSTIFIIIGAIAAAVVVIGGGAALLLRRSG